MFINQPGTASLILARLPGCRLNQYLDRSSGRYSEQSKAKQSAELAHTRIAYTSASSCTDGKPNLIAGSRAIYGLQHEVKSEGKLEFADNYYRRLVSPYCHYIAAADFALDREAEGFEVALDRPVKARLRPPLLWHGITNA
jgi:hypothetical protein